MFYNMRSSEPTAKLFKDAFYHELLLDPSKKPRIFPPRTLFRPNLGLINLPKMAHPYTIEIQDC